MTVDRTRARTAKKSRGNGKDQGENKSKALGSSNSVHQSRKPPGWRTSA